MNSHTYKDYQVKILHQDIDVITLQHIITTNAEIYIDIETNGLNIFRDRICKIQILCDKNIYIFDVSINHTIKQFSNLNSIFNNNKIAKVFHHARTDVAFLKRFGFNIKNIFCTKIASKIIRTYSDKHGLQSICKDLLGETLNKSLQQTDWGKSLNEYDNDIIPYLCNDIVYLPSIKNKLIEIGKREKRYNLLLEVMSILDTIINIELQHIKLEHIFFHNIDNKETLIINR